MVAPIGGISILPQSNSSQQSEAEPPPAEETQQVSQPAESDSADSSGAQSGDDQAQSGASGANAGLVATARDTQSDAVVAASALAASGVEARGSGDAASPPEGEAALRATAEAMRETVRTQQILGAISDSVAEADAGGARDVPNLVVEPAETRAAAAGFAEADAMSSPLDQPSVDARS